MAKQNVTVVTGASGNLGSAVVRELVALGHAVVALVHERSAERARALIGSHPGLVVTGDATSPEVWAKLVDETSRGLGAPTGAALIAGSWRGGRDEAAWRAMLEANLDTARLGLDALLPGMLERESGSVVLVGSRAAVRPWESAKAAAYAATKAAVVALGSAAAAEVLESGVRVNTVLPSTIGTPQNRAAMPDADASRWVAPESIARVIAFLLSDGARDVSGAAIPVYGRA